ncbi:phosphate acyltransferase PlsX [Francisella sp. 19X1-34]|uniref:phosphate acyltransferase PlsX n=1 Tax=Francisella sp. 19X1-34 TaxID=3087177 RepID=UPI002E36EBF6|nr:phosphate acyltransferase PlsX [Francisella sp. 19X1-34]MED7788654.1 phosphate acyltransferase PlsX [Francisella sp. 19X1-34]
MSYKISIDAMGGDNGLNTTIPAALEAVKKDSNLQVVLVGDHHKVKRALDRYSKVKKIKLPVLQRVAIHHASETVAMDESPSIAVRKKKDSSMRVAINLVKDGTVDACVSAGNTGALMATSKFVLKTVNGVDRPAIVYALPAYNRETKQLSKTYMLDLGANVVCSSEQLFQFAIMGSILAASSKGVTEPRVSLLNIGEEEMKGLDNIKNAAKLLQGCDFINYQGYIEGKYIFDDSTDVIVCDGFVGNVSLKTMEGSLRLIESLIKKSMRETSWLMKIPLIMALPFFKKMKTGMNLDSFNGASLLGLTGIVVKSHGSASANAFETAIYEAIKEIKYNIPKTIQESLEKVL